MDAFICFSHKIIGSNRKQKHLTFKTYEFIYSLCIHEIFFVAYNNQYHNIFINSNYN